MSEKTEALIEKKVQETQRYFYVDGLVEMGVGLIFVLTGLVLVTWMLFEGNRPLQIASALALPVLAIGGTWLMKRTVTALKQRVTYPRTGYVSYRPGEPSRGRWLVIAATLLLILTSSLLPAVMQKMGVMVGALLAIVLAFLGYRVSLGRFYFAAAATVVAGVAAAIFIGDELLGAALTFVVSGAVLLLAGAFAFTRYLQAHPASGEEMEG